MARPQLVCGWLSTSACSLHVAVRNRAWAAAARGSPRPDEALAAAARGSPRPDEALAGRLKPLAAVPQCRLADLLVPAAEGQPEGTVPGGAATTGRRYVVPLKPSWPIPSANWLRLKPSLPIPSADWPWLKPLAAARPRPNCTGLRPPGPRRSQTPVGHRPCSGAAMDGRCNAAAIKAKLGTKRHCDASPMH